MPLLDAMKRWLDGEQRTALPRTPVREALTYAANQWAALNVYLRGGSLSIDNSAAERAVKPIAIGRKDSLFFGSDHGRQTLATLASFTTTCELFHINPWTYLRDFLTRMPTTPDDQLASLLPSK